MTWTFLGGPLHGYSAEVGGRKYVLKTYTPLRSAGFSGTYFRNYTYVPIRVQGMRVVAALEKR
jgi:hypothetical protein